MSYWTLVGITLAVFFALFLIAIYLLIPKAIQSQHLWRKNGKSIDLSNMIATGTVAFGLLAANLLVFLQMIWRKNLEFAADHVSFLRSVLFLGMFVLAVFFCVPRAYKFWRLWERTGKTIHLSNAVAIGAVAFFFLAGNLLLLLQAAGGYATH